jgi:hypothetical protein
MREKIKEEKEKVKKEGAEEEEEEKTMKPEGGDLPPSAAFSQSPTSSHPIPSHLVRGRQYVERLSVLSVSFPANSLRE